MPVNKDFEDLLRIFHEEKVEYLIVGAYAVIFYTEPRYTKDLDIWINPTEENAKKVWKALQRFGAPLIDVTVKDFTNRELVYQIGVEPNRIDILMDIQGVDFEEAFSRKVVSKYGDVPIYIISKEDLIKAKEATGRLEDKLDLEKLKKY